MDTTFIISVIGAILGSGGLAAVITAILSARKYRAEANDLERKSRQDMDEYMNRRMKELTDMYVKETQDLKAQNKELQNQINDLQDKMQELISWIVHENYTNIALLKAKIKECDPSYQFPEIRPFPNPWKDDDTHPKPPPAP